MFISVARDMDNPDSGNKWVLSEMCVLSIALLSEFHSCLLLVIFFYKHNLLSFGLYEVILAKLNILFPIRTSGRKCFVIMSCYIILYHIILHFKPVFLKLCSVEVSEEKAWQK
jgi:hypothetical protein